MRCHAGKRSSCPNKRSAHILKRHLEWSLEQCQSSGSCRRGALPRLRPFCDDGGVGLVALVPRHDLRLHCATKSPACAAARYNSNALPGSLGTPGQCSNGKRDCWQQERILVQPQPGSFPQPCRSFFSPLLRARSQEDSSLSSHTSLNESLLEDKERLELRRIAQPQD